MNLSAADLIHLVLGSGVIAGVTFLAAIHVLPGDSVIPTYLAVAGISGAVQVGSNSIRAIIAQNTAAPLVPVVSSTAPVPEVVK